MVSDRHKFFVNVGSLGSEVAEKLGEWAKRLDLGGEEWLADGRASTSRRRTLAAGSRERTAPGKRQSSARSRPWRNRSEGAPSKSARISKTGAQRRGPASRPRGPSSWGITRQAATERKPQMTQTTLPSSGFWWTQIPRRGETAERKRQRAM